MPDLQDRQVVASGSLQEICDFLHCSRSTLKRRIKDNPDAFVRLGRSQLLVLIPRPATEKTETKTV